MEITKEFKQHCIAFSQAYERFEQLLFDWGVESKPLMREVKNHLLLERDGEYPLDYFRYSAPALMLHRVLTDGKMLKRFQNTQEKFMVSREKQVLSCLLERPAFWCFFTILEIYEEEYALIEDLYSGETHLMHSPNLCLRKRMDGSRPKSYLSLMMYTGQCLANIGLLRSYTLSKTDMCFYCSLFAGSESDDETTLGEVINDHYNDFFVLDKTNATTRVMHGEYELRQTWQSFHLEDFDINRLGGTWTSTQVGALRKYTLVTHDQSIQDLPNGNMLSSDPPLMKALIVRDHDSGDMGFMTTSEPAHALYKALFEHAYPELALPQEPEVSIPTSLLFRIVDVGLPLPWGRFEVIMKNMDDMQP